jgi:hypothetical protein
VADIEFKYGSLIRTGPSLVYGGKWNSDLADYVRNGSTNADLSIYIDVYFKKIDPAGNAGLYGDSDDTPTSPSKRKIQRWKPGEFERYTQRLISQAQRYWTGKFWLKTPKKYKELDWPDKNPTHRCNLYCKFELNQAYSEGAAQYTIAVVRVKDSEVFRSDSVLYSQKDIESESLIPSSTTKFWTHFHEVGHLLGLGHVGHGGTTNVSNDNSPQAYGVTKAEMEDVMGMGSRRHLWHARPWQEAAKEFTGIDIADWEVHTNHIYPRRLIPGDR